MFYPKGYVPKYNLNSSTRGDTDDLDIPAGARQRASDGYYRLTKNARLIAFKPHMHNRGKAQCLEAIYPDGKRRDAQLRQLQFGWQIVYNYADDVQPLLPAGTMMHVISWHDNIGGQPLQSRSAELGRFRPAHDRRHELCVGQLRLDDRRRLPEAGR